MQERFTYIQSVMKSGDDLVQSGNLGGDSIIKSTDEMNLAYWTNLLDLSGISRTRLSNSSITIRSVVIVFSCAAHYSVIQIANGALVYDQRKMRKTI